MAATALVVDDEVDLCRLMQITLTKMGIKSDIAYDLASAKEFLKTTDYDFCLTDLRLPDGSGLELVKQISATSTTPVAVITAHGSMDLAIEALKLGAFDFVNKPLELPRLRKLVENALKVAQQIHETPNSNQQSPEQALLDSRLIGNSPAMVKLKSTIVKLARSQAPVFLWGESGTGKEVVARLIHDLSPRREGSFVPVNCGAIPSELMESEFFGHKKGSFTGANTDKIGLFQQANGGTLFLDEVADLPLAMQVKLLRAIQEKTIRAIGDTKEVAVDIRILSATHKDLSHLVQTGAFRQDLFYRINVIELKLPTLNERSGDIPALAKHFLTLIAEDWQLENQLELTPSACARLQTHNFEGNVRELRNLLERAVTLTDASVIDVAHLGIEDKPAEHHQDRTTQDNALVKQQPDPANNTTALPKADTANLATAHISSHTQASSSSANTGFKIPHPYQTAGNQYSAKVGVSQVPATQNTNSSATHPLSATIAQTTNSSVDTVTNANVDDQKDDLPKEGLEAYLQEQEKALIITALNKTDWNKTKAAELLGTSFRSLRYRMKKLEIEEDRDGS